MAISIFKPVRCAQAAGTPAHSPKGCVGHHLQNILRDPLEEGRGSVVRLQV